MNNLKRQEFLKKMAILFAATSIMPKALWAIPAKEIEGSEKDADDSFVLNEFAIIDLHCHPSQKMWLWGKKFWNAHWSVAKGENIFPMQENHRQFSFGNVRGILASHYLLEKATEREWNTLKVFYPLIKFIPFLHIKDKIEYEDARNFDQVKRMIEMLNGQMSEMNSRQSDIKYVIATDYTAFEAALNDPEKKSVAIAHAIEGAHALGRNFAVSAKKQKENEDKKLPLYKMTPSVPGQSPYIENLLAFKKMGVCLITLAHFFRNDLVYPVDGISPDSKDTPAMEWEFTPDQDRGLSPTGVEVVSTMLDVGMIVDLTHTAPKARHEVFMLNRDVTIARKAKGLNPRPIVFTHTGAQQIYEYYDHRNYPFYKYYSVSDKEIDLICECNGVIGIIAEVFWLTGGDANMPKQFKPEQFRFGIPYMIQTMKYINSKTRTKQYDNVGIGTDFDGLADNPKDLFKNKQLKDLIEAMKNDPELNQGDYIAKITSLNTKRVLKDGWGI